MGEPSQPGAPSQEFLALAAMTHAMVFVSEPTGKMLWANEELERQTGFRVEDFWFENQQNPFIHPDDLERVAGFLAAFAESDATRSASVENRFIDEWGRIHVYRSVVSKVEWQGAPAFMVHATPYVDDDPCTDVGIGATYQHLVERASDGIVKLDRNGTFNYSNARFHEMAGREATELKGQTFLELVVEADRERAREALASIPKDAAKGFAVRLDTDAGEVCVDVRASVLSRGRDEGLILAFVRDVTEAPVLERKLRQTQKLESLGVLAGGVAHDFNNIATGILANAELAREEASPNSELDAVLSDLVVAGEQAAAVTRTLLAYLGQAPTRVAPIELGELVEEQARLWRALIDRRVELDVHRADKPIAVKADRSHLAQVLMNFVTNGAEASGASRISIDFSVEPIDCDTGRWFPAAPAPGKYAQIRVRDDGAGMDPETMSRIFDPFFTTKSTGRGMGLAAALGIVRSHGGAISIDSQPGAGTTFTLVLPMTDEQPNARTASRAPKTDATHGGRVLLVDDEDMVRRVTARILTRLGYEVVDACDGQSALAAFEAGAGDFRLAVVDQSMPGMSGTEVIRRLRASAPSLPIVHASGFGGLPEADAGSVNLPKPFGPKELLAAIDLAVGGD